MTVLFPVLIRRAAAEAERRLRSGAGLLAAIAGEPEHTERDALRRLLAQEADREARLHRLEQLLHQHDREVRALRTDLDSLIAQLNERLLPRIDERMDDAERDLAGLATSLVRTGREAASQRSGLQSVENRVSDLRGRLARLEQRAGLWRDVQANIARISDDIDGLRSRLPGLAASADPATAPDRVAQAATGMAPSAAHAGSVPPEPVIASSASAPAAVGDPGHQPLTGSEAH